MRALQIDQFMNCCGIEEIGCFLDTNGESVEVITREILETIRYQGEQSACIATTIPSQKKAIKALRLAKFQPLVKFRAAYGKRNFITLWIKTGIRRKNGQFSGNFAQWRRMD